MFASSSTTKMCATPDALPYERRFKLYGSSRAVIEEIQLGPLPALAIGADGPPLLYLGGLLPTAGVDGRLARRSAEFSARPLADMRRVVYTNRRSGLPNGMTIAEIAAGHARAIDAIGAGALDVVGVSTGGSIAQQLAADHPETVRRLVLLSTGCRLSTKARRLQSHVSAQVRDGKERRAIVSVALAVLVPGSEFPARFLAPLLAPLVGRVGDLSDLATTLEAEDAFDLAGCDGTIRAPTLIVAGSRDRFYPRRLLEETQQLIPGSVLHRIPRRGHLTVMTSSRLIPLMRAFLDAERAADVGGPSDERSGAEG
jgi:pimeloyl-ACP methyl ester carboxylesterase